MYYVCAHTFLYIPQIDLPVAGRGNSVPPKASPPMGSVSNLNPKGGRPAVVARGGSSVPTKASSRMGSVTSQI